MPADEKSISRNIEIPGDKSLYDKSLYELAARIVSAFDFDFEHAFGFYSGLTSRTMMEKDPKHELFADMGKETDALSVKKTRVTEAFPKVTHKPPQQYPEMDDEEE